MLDKTIFTPHGRHLIAGEWVAGEATFAADPAHGAAHEYSVGEPAHVDRACAAAEEAFWSFGSSSREVRAALLNAIADEIEARGDAITEIGTQETGLPEARLQGERGRTTGQLRLFASHILSGSYLDQRCPTVSLSAPRPEDGSAPHRSGGDLRRVELPARVLDRGW